MPVMFGAFWQASGSLHTIEPLVDGVLYRIPGPSNPWIATQGFLLTPPAAKQGVLIDPMAPPSEAVVRDINAAVAYANQATAEEPAVSHLFISHNHIVGTSGWRRWRTAFPGLRVVADESEVDADDGVQRVSMPPHVWMPYAGEDDASWSAQFFLAKIPGHRPGHLAFLYQDGDYSFLWGGDTLDPASERFCEDSVSSQVVSLLWLRDSLSSDIVAPTVVLPTHGTVTTGSGLTWFQNDITTRIKGFSKQYWKYTELRPRQGLPESHG